MKIQCPHCRSVMELKGAKAGTYRPRCTKCSGKLELTISDSPDTPPRVRAIDTTGGTMAGGPMLSPASGGSIAGRAALDATVPPSSPSGPSPARTMPAGTMPAAKQPMSATAPPTSAGQVRTASASDIATDDQLTGRLGGYELLHLLGKGGMGNVYLARQISLDRNVAVKTLTASLAGDPEFLARFTREAYAAAQLNHHNVVQIHELGDERRVRFFSMEFVEGQSLGDILKEETRLEPDVAAGYILQAARGLKFAHDNGLIHRDIKPENLLLNKQGVVKVADLGLVKSIGQADPAMASRPGASTAAGGSFGNTTQLNVSMGTPAYMAPEQARDAANVDARADIYALGCTLYALVTGRPPFSGKTIVEVITKHAQVPVTPPEAVVQDIGPVLSGIIMKMVAKRPQDRFDDMGQVAKALEDYLGVSTAGAFRPTEEHTKIIEGATVRFNQSQWARVRSKVPVVFYGLCGLAAVISFLLVKNPVWQWGLAGGFIGLAVMTTLAHQVIVGVRHKTHLYGRLRELVLGAGPLELLKYSVLMVLLGLLLYLLGLFWSWMAFGVVAVALAAGFHFSLDMLAEKERQAATLQTEALLKRLRLKGLDENTLRQFVCRYAGNQWEEFYEALFGYEAKITARRMWGKNDRGQDRDRHAAWRDAAIGWMDATILKRKLRRDQKMLAGLESQALEARGISQAEAKRRATRDAEKLVERASVFRRTAAKRAAATLAPPSANDAAKAAAETAAFKTSLATTAGAGTNWIHDADAAMEEEDDEDERRRRRSSRIGRRFGGPLDWVFGPMTRFALGAILLLGFGLWWRANGQQQVIDSLARFQGQSTDPTVIAARDAIGGAKEQGQYTFLQITGITFAQDPVGRQTRKAAVVDSVSEPSRAAEAGIVRNDIVLSVNQTKVEDANQALTQLSGGATQYDLRVQRNGQDLNLRLDLRQRSVPLNLSGVPAWVTGGVPQNPAGVGSYNGALAAMLLILASLFAPRKIALVVYVAAAIALFAPMFSLPSVGAIKPLWAAVAGVSLGFLGIFWFRDPPG